MYFLFSSQFFFIYFQREYSKETLAASSSVFFSCHYCFLFLSFLCDDDDKPFPFTIFILHLPFTFHTSYFSEFIWKSRYKYVQIYVCVCVCVNWGATGSPIFLARYSIWVLLMVCYIYGSPCIFHTENVYCKTEIKLKN